MLDAMTKKEPDGLGSMSQIGVRLPPPLVEEVDAIVERKNAAAGWRATSRSDVLREAVEKGLAVMKAEDAPPKPARKVRKAAER